MDSTNTVQDPPSQKRKYAPRNSTPLVMPETNLFHLKDVQALNLEVHSKTVSNRIRGMINKKIIEKVGYSTYRFRSVGERLEVEVVSSPMGDPRKMLLGEYVMLCPAEQKRRINRVYELLYKEGKVARMADGTYIFPPQQ